MSTKFFKVALLAMIIIIAATACGPAATATQAPTQPPVTPPTAVPATAVPPTAVPPTAEPFTFGMLLVGTKNDQGWSQAHYDAGLYVEQKIPGTKMIYLENVFSGSPAYTGTTTSQLAEQLVSQGAKLVIFNSDDMKDEATKFAQDHPDIKVIMASGDQVWQEGQAYVAMPNMVNIMGRVEYMKMIGGCAAALTSQTGKIGYLGALINDETRRLAASAYLGAKYCWQQAGKDPAALQFKVTWIGFWFYIPGFSSDPTQVADDFFNSGYDVVISGIDTTEALIEAKKFNDTGKPSWAVSYDYLTNCNGAPEVCLGVPYFKWGPAYLATIKTAIDGTWKSEFQWLGPDWTDLNNPDTGAVGFTKGAGLSAENSTKLDAFIAELAGGLNLWTGPINLQDGTAYLADGVVGTDQQVWYLHQLLEGMEGQSVPSN
jgi:simple sugar transport system substrate-binding protein